MPAISSSAKVLVTGVNGFIGVWIAKFLLERGYSVRGTVRALSKGEHVKKVLTSFKDRLEIVEVADITVPGAFDEAVKDIDGIVHNASPFHFNVDDPDELIIPAVRGTTGILESTSKYGPQVKRIVVLSSTAAVVDSGIKGKLDESSWNIGSLEEVQNLGRNASPGAKYRASKTLAEKSLWDFYEKHKSEVSWDPVALNPPYVFGPILHEVHSPASLNTSLKSFYDTVLAPNIPPERIKAFTGSFVDVRDVAEAHVRALEVSEAGGHRVILSYGSFNAQDFFDIVHESGIKDVATPVGNPGAGKDIKYDTWYDNARARTLLKIEFRDKKTVALDTIESMREHGFLKA